LCFFNDGATTEKIQQLAQSLGHSQRAQRQLRSPFWWVRLGALRFFSGLGKVPDQLERCLHDRHPLVRAEAIYLVPQEPTPERVARVVRELFAPPSPARFASHSVLLQLSGLAEKPLVGYLKELPAGCETVEVALRAACGLASPAMLDSALQHSASSDRKVQGAAAQLLGCIGGQASIERLLDMLEGPSRAAAAEALGHLVYWQAAPRLALMLQDPTYDVRYQAALALRGLGPPGILFLRQAGQQDHLGSSVARLVVSQC